MSTWAQVREELAQGAQSAVLENNEHYEVLFNPYPPDPEGKRVEDVECLVTTRKPVNPSEYRPRPPPQPQPADGTGGAPVAPTLRSSTWRYGLWPRISPVPDLTGAEGVGQTPTT